MFMCFKRMNKINLRIFFFGFEINVDEMQLSAYENTQTLFSD